MHFHIEFLVKRQDNQVIIAQNGTNPVQAADLATLLQSLAANLPKPNPQCPLELVGMRILPVGPRPEPHVELATETDLKSLLAMRR